MFIWYLPVIPALLWRYTISCSTGEAGEGSRRWELTLGKNPLYSVISKT